MAFTDDPTVQVADLHNYADDGRSLLDDANDFVAKGVPLAVASGLYSMYNTAVSLGNTLGGDYEKADFDKDVEAYDDDLSMYYQKHKTGVDLGGFVATSFIPGMAGMKALKFLQAGKLGETAMGATNLFKSAEAKFLEKATSSIQQETNQVFNLLDTNKLGAIAAGFGEQTLQAAAFETGVMVTMNQNPVINPDQQSYFKNIVYNTPDLVKNALLGGAIGGSIEALRVSGKLKTLIKTRDSDDFPSLNIPEIGLSDIDEGTKAGIDFAWLRSREAKFVKDAADGKLNDRQISNYRRTQAQKATELQLRITEQLADGDADLGKQVWNHLNGLQEDPTIVGLYGNKPEDIATTILGAATSISRVGIENLPVSGVEKVMHEDGYLSPRHAKLILTRGKMAPGTYDAMDDATAAELGAADFELYKDSAGNTRVIPGTKYAKTQLTRSIKKESHSLIIKLTGDQAGQITESAYPVIGDLGKVAISKKGDFLLNKEIREVPEFDPLKNTPIDSNAAFVKEQLTPKFSEESELGTLTENDLPLIEKAHREGFEGISVAGFEGDENVSDILKQLKLEWRQKLLDAGHGFDQIARELNVSRQFAETGQGEFALSTIEDHTRPQYAKVEYNTKALPDKFVLRGMVDLMQRVQIAREHTSKMAAFILGKAYNLLPQTKGTMLGINTIPELSGFFRSASEDYGNFGQLMQQVGKVVESTSRDRVAAVFEQIAQWEKKIRGDQKLQIELNTIVAKVRSMADNLASELVEDGEGKTQLLIYPKDILETATKKDGSLDEEKFQELLDDALAKKNAFQTQNEEVAQYLQTTKEINTHRVGQWNAYFAGRGSSTSYDPDAFYLPPINTRKYPFVAFVRESAEREVRPISVVTAQSAADLESQIRKIKQEFGDVVDIFTKEDVKNFHRLQGEYESGLLLGRSTVDNTLARRGILSQFAPRTDDVILDDFNNWHWQQEQALVRNAVELQYAQEFAELRAMGQQFTEFQESVFGKGDKRLQDNPYQRYLQTALGTSNYSKYDSVWGRLNSGVEAVGTSMFKVWQTFFGKANKGEVDWITANKEAERLGFRPPYQDPLREIFNPAIENKKVVETLVAKANAATATLVLRLDPLNAIVNILGTPGLIASELAVIRKNISDPTIVGQLANLLNVGIPGTQMQLPSTMKLMTAALKNFIQDDGSRLKYYQDIGAVQTDLQLYKSAIDATRLQASDVKDVATASAWTKTLLDKATMVGSKLTGNALSERMVRFVAADIMKQITDIAKVPVDQVPAYINTFVNRVHGNFVASQRPALFQGAVGSAISLFQTYQFNVLQNMVRYVERNDKAAVAALLGMQNTLFGFQGNPAFYLMNSYIGNENRQHNDLTSGIYATVGKDVGDWMLYGLGSNALHVNLYNRGDLTPRYVTVVPTNLLDSPAISIAGKTIAAFLGSMSSIWKGGSVPASILNGIAHNGFNRPLAGIAQLAQGYRTTTGGNLLTAYNDLDTATVAAKILGGEELNRAVAIDAYYRQNAYRAKDKEKIAELGAALKTKLYKNHPIDSSDVETFMKEYSASGGRVESFNQWMMTNYKNANRSQINKLLESPNSPYAKNIARIMGGIPLEDLRTVSEDQTEE